MESLVLQIVSKTVMLEAPLHLLNQEGCGLGETERHRHLKQ